MKRESDVAEKDPSEKRLPGLLRHYLHPASGRRIHIASTPEAVDGLRRQLSKTPDDDSFDVYIQGSPEHLEALRQIRTHHESRAADLRSKHGEQIYGEFEQVHRELDALAVDLRELTSSGGAGGRSRTNVALDANFDRFGYSARIRTIAAEPSGTSTPRSRNPSGAEHLNVVSTNNDNNNNNGGEGGSGDGGGDGFPEDDGSDIMKIWKKPSLRQYHHKGFLWRSSDSKEVESFELFIDLLYVGVVGILGDAASEEPTGRALLEFAVVFILAWKMWVQLSISVAYFETGGVSLRMSVLVWMACLCGFIINIQNGFGGVVELSGAGDAASKAEPEPGLGENGGGGGGGASNETVTGAGESASGGEPATIAVSTYTEMIAFYVANRLYEATYYAYTSYHIPMARGMLFSTAIIIVVPTALWIASIHVEEPARWAVIWVAIALDLFGPGIIVPFIRSSEKMQKGPLGFLAKRMTIFPALNIEHKIERMGAFVTLVFGYSVLALLFQSALPVGLSAFYGKAVLGLITAFCFNILYFDVDCKRIRRHAIRRHALAFFFWQNLHLPFMMAFTLASGALARLVVVRDCPNVELVWLAEASAAKSAGEVSAGLRWFYCAGLGIALACMGGIALAHEHKSACSSGVQQRLPKRARLSVRFAVAAVLVCLPLSNDALSSLQLIAVVACLLVFAVAVDLLGSTARGESFWRDCKRCHYEADCRLRKKDMEDLALGGGGAATLDEMARRNVAVEKGGVIIS